MEMKRMLFINCTQHELTEIQKKSIEWDTCDFVNLKDLNPNLFSKLF